MVWVILLVQYVVVVLLSSRLVATKVLKLDENAAIVQPTLLMNSGLPVLNT
ncbi:hypothetical protein D3C86_2134500 [compost metagenome]